MPVTMVVVTVLAFVATLLFVFWRPRGLNEAIPAVGGAILVLLSGSVTLKDLGTISETVSGAAITILATIVMANVLESFGFFSFMSEKLISYAKGSGIRLFWLVNLLCFMMTLLFNNDGSILITTPILLLLLKKIGLKPSQQIPYLMSGALIATASSAPIGVSNIVNLISLKVVGMDLYMFTEIMFIPATLGLAVLLLLLFAVFYKELPRKLPTAPKGFGKHSILIRVHPLLQKPTQQQATSEPSEAVEPSNSYKSTFIRNILLFVLAVRISLFVASYFGVPVSIAAVIGSVVLLAWRWWHLKIAPTDIFKKTPWHILVFAYGMYIIIYGLHNIGLTAWVISLVHPFVSSSLLHASFLMGALVTLMSNLFNNHPALMIGTLTLTNMHLDPVTLKVAYLANVVGSDIGSLLLPIGTLATLIWMHILKKAHVKISWKKYVKVTFLVIPLTVVVTLFLLYYWVLLVF
ncbi:MAG: arsenic transporter [Tumebacillaceae bacterium]